MGPRSRHVLSVLSFGHPGKSFTSALIILIISSFSGVKARFSLDSVQPLGFINSVRLASDLQLIGLDNNTFVEISIKSENGVWSMSSPREIKTFESVKLISTNWPEQSCDCIIKDHIQSCSKLIKFDANGQIQESSRFVAPNEPFPRRVLHKSDDCQIGSSGNCLLIFADHADFIDLGDVAIAADYCKPLGRPGYAVVATSTMLQLIQLVRNEIKVVSSAIVKNKITTMSKV